MYIKFSVYLELCMTISNIKYNENKYFFKNSEWIHIHCKCSNNTFIIVTLFDEAKFTSKIIFQRPYLDEWKVELVAMKNNHTCFCNSVCYH